MKNAIFLFLFATLFANAQTFILSGKVVDENQEPLEGATVLVKELKKGTSTNFDGVFIVNLSEGVYRIEVSFLGYQTVSKSITVSKNENMLFSLEEQAVETVLEEVLVTAVRVKTNAPVAHSNVSKKEIAKRNLGQDIPILLNYLPSVVTTSDAGTGIGYTGIRVRGSDATRVNVTINGIPYNDSESQGTFWVNMPDFASSTQSIQLQRGVGTSTNGAGAFGASLNVLTDTNAQVPFGEIATSLGSFNTQKNTVKLGTGTLNKHTSFTGRFSKISSEGYVDRASSDLKSYFLQGSYIDDNTLIKALVFGGHEITYQSWNGNDGETLKTRRTFNSAGALYNEDWSLKSYYDNEVDNYKQDHSQLHWNQWYSKNLSSNIALHYTYGRGFYEHYQQAINYDKEGNGTIISVENQDATNTDSIRRKWLDNDFYGVTFNLNYKNSAWDVLFGGAWNTYQGDHFGEVIWARYASKNELGDRYYDNFGDKDEVNLYMKATYKIDGAFSLFGDLQNRRIGYKANGVQEELVNDSFNFFNPKAGVNYQLNTINSFYVSYARANREPNRSDYENGNPKPERLDDFELGWRLHNNHFKINTNMYYMFYTDQLALTGEIDDVGAAIRANIGESYRLGLEIDAMITLNNYVTFIPNFTVSKNKNKDLKEIDGAIVTLLGETNISYSPNIIAGNTMVISPSKYLNISLLSKYVGTQFMSNNELEVSILDSYFVNDLNINYTIQTKKFFNQIVVTGLINNLFNEVYSSNGFMWGITPYYYPQATRNFLIGVTLKF